MSLAIVGLVSIGSPGRATLNPVGTTPAPMAAVQFIPFSQNATTVETVPTIPVPAPSPSVAPAADPAEPNYTTLAAAVAAQAMPASASDEMRCLAVAIYHEAKGEPLAGQLAVANVVINRSNSGRFPNTVCSVIKQPGQFSFVRAGKLPALDTSRPAYRTALAVAQVALSETWESPAPAALFFHARTRTVSWNRPQVAAIGNHIFYR